MSCRVLAVVGSLATLFCASAALAADCSPVGSLPNYVASQDLKQRDYDQAEFYVKKGDDAEAVQVAGHLCFQSYTIKDGADVLSDLEIQTNYRDQLKKLGGELLQTEGRATYAKIVEGGQETWIKVYSQENYIEVTVVEKGALKQTLLPASGNDYRLVGHMPNYVAGPPEKRNFDKLAFSVQDGDDSREVEVTGAKFFVTYDPKDGVEPSSDLEIQQNYRNALTAAGAQILFADGRSTVARLDDKGQPIWIKIYSQETYIEVTVIEEKAFQSSIKPPEANAMKAALEKDGRIALYVNFDFNKATLKPDAAPVIAQVVKLMKDNPSLKLEVGGHTDNIGSHDYNVRLSGSRAAAVMAAVTSQGVAAGRLSATGFGPDKPIADNATGEGRARNRRVELVKP